MVPLDTISSFRISIIIPTWNRPAALARCLRSIMNQTCAPAEVIIVDASEMRQCSDLVDSIIKDNPPFELKYASIEHELRGIPRQRNIGIRLSRHEIVGFLDDATEMICPTLTTFGPYSKAIRATRLAASKVKSSIYCLYIWGSGIISKSASAFSTLGRFCEWEGSDHYCQKAIHLWTSNGCMAAIVFTGERCLLQMDLRRSSKDMPLARISFFPMSYRKAGDRAINRKRS